MKIKPEQADIKELMYGGPYWTLVEDEDEDKPIADARDKHLIMQKEKWDFLQIKYFNKEVI